MNAANIAREYGVWETDESGRTRLVRTFWSFGQAMNTAMQHADRFPDSIVFLDSRVVVQNDWEGVPEFEEGE